MAELFDTRLPERFWDKVMPIAFSGCWAWMASLDRKGYGQIMTRVRGKNVLRRAHHLAYAELIGTTPDGMELDHLCRVKLCCNPNHLEPVTHRVNMIRGIRKTNQTHCKNGHPLSGDNLIFKPKYNRRECRICRLANNRLSYHRVRHGK